MSQFITTLSQTIALNQDDFSGYNYFLIDASAAPVTITLSSLICWDGNGITFHRVDATAANALTLAADTGYTINGAASITLAPGQLTRAMFLGSNWNAPRVAFT